ncbi:MAG TPA: ABC transporter substrate-binding protein, partial [Thermomicrobiales bacterium]|nr:ABC transporter substrate-binding protein [Thermomicrobiales bacterium]
MIAAVAMMMGSSCSALEPVVDASGSGQHLTLAGSPAGIETLDPAQLRDVESAFLARQVFRGLVRLDDHLQPVPDLARSIEVSQEGSEYQFTLHQTATFHDGSPIDAHAVVRSFNRASDPGLAGDGDWTPPAATYFDGIVGIDARISGAADQIAGIEAVDRWNVRIVLDRPEVNFLSRLAGPPAAIVDTRTANGDNWWQSPNGSGPFRVKEFAAGSRLVLAPHDGYPGGEPRIQLVTVLFGSQAVQPMNLYEEGSIDVVSVPSWAVDRVLTPGDALHDDLVQTRTLSTTFIAMNPNIAPFDDPDVRRMFAGALDRAKLVEVGFEGNVVLADGLIPPGIGGQRWPSDTYEFDEAKAARIASTHDVDEARPTIYEPGGGIGSVLKADLNEPVGVEIDVIDLSWPEFSARLVVQNMASFVLTWVADYPDPENTLAALLRTGSPDNYLAYSNPEFDRLVDEAAVEADDERRRQLYLEAQNVAVRDAVVIPLYHGMSYTLVQPRVRGLSVTEIGILSLA